MSKDYDKILTRLIGILSKISNNERCNTQEFAQEYNVGVRTIQKDIRERLINFPITKDINGKFMFIDGFTLNKSLLNNDEMILVSLALNQFRHIKDFDKITESTLKKLLNPKLFNPYFIIPSDFENIKINSSKINMIKDSIQYKSIIKIDGKIVEPYKIIASKGIWYLFAKDINDGKNKSFLISDIKNVELTNNKYFTVPELNDYLLHNLTQMR